MCIGNSTGKQNKVSLKSKLDVGSIRENYKEFVKNNKLTLKPQQRLRAKKQCMYWGGYQDCIEY